MSVEMIAKLAADRMPTPQQWQEAISKHGFDLKMDTDFDVAAFGGFLPCEFEWQEAGFEYSYRLSGASLEISLITHSDLREFISSAIAGAVLVHMTDGTLIDPDDVERQYRGEEALAYAREMEQEASG